MAFSVLEKVALFLLSIIGLFVLRELYRLIYENVVSPIVNKVNFKEQGQWALITGSTDGLGKAYARALAKMGCDIILVSRSETKLKKVAEEIELDFKVRTKIIAADFVEMKDAYDKIEAEIQGLEIGTLINNVGISYPYPDYFLDLKNGQEIFQSILKANIETVVRLCHLVMPPMVERHRGIVINVSSASAVMPGPLLAVYAASKLFVDKLTEDLSSEYSKRGLIIQSVLPGYVATKMSKMRASLLSPDADAFVESALKTVGSKTHTCGYLPHSVMVFVTNFLGFMWPSLLVWVVTRTLENVRRRTFRKLAKKILSFAKEGKLLEPPGGLSSLSN